MVQGIGGKKNKKKIFFIKILTLGGALMFLISFIKKQIIYPNSYFILFFKYNPFFNDLNHH